MHKSKTTNTRTHFHKLSLKPNIRRRRNMEMIKASWVSIFAFAAILLVIIVPAAEAVTCSPMQLSPCASAITSSSQPSALCCAKLKEQKPCLCGYMRNRSLRRFVSSPNARKVSNRCKLPIPRC
ncbi:non-specific lipid-transfer protein 2-like [Brassica napus]|nr:non-specific lipid-transfer protein 2-like [Brassica napus]